MKIVVIVGSLRKDSFNRKAAHALLDFAPPSLNLELVEIGDLPLFNDDLDEAGTPPAAWTKFRAKIKSADGVIFVSPEYNRSVPGVLKNAIDVGSRPDGHNAWQGKPAGIVNVSTGRAGGSSAHHHLRQTLVALNLPTLPQPEACIGLAEDVFDQEGKVSDERTQKFLRKFVDAYAAWAAKILGAR